jgi:GT2 family glycosyltransferase
MASLASALVLYHKEEAYVRPCLDALMRQTHPDIEVFFIDNGSKDGAADYVRANYPGVRVIVNDSNLHFSKAHNIGIRESRGSYVMPFNVDVVATETYIEQMVWAMDLDSTVGMVSGKLLRTDSDLRPFDPPIIDSTGMWFTPELRHFDRGAEEKDEGQYDRLEYIFGPSGAAPLYRREMLEGIAFQGEYFDEDFVRYREDADLAWRAQLLGWKGLYTPSAVAYHVRRVRPSDSRRKISPEINMHSVKNRFLMRIKNQTWGNAFRSLLPTLWRDLLVVGYVILVEHTSLPAFVEVVRLFPRMLEKRRLTMSKKRVSDDYIASWFSYRPVSFPYQGYTQLQ